MHIHIVTWFSRGSVFPATPTLLLGEGGQLSVSKASFWAKGSVCADSPAPPSSPPLFLPMGRGTTCVPGASGRRPGGGQHWALAQPNSAAPRKRTSPHIPAESASSPPVPACQSVRRGFSLLFALSSYFSVGSWLGKGKLCYLLGPSNTNTSLQTDQSHSDFSHYSKKIYIPQVLVIEEAHDYTLQNREELRNRCDTTAQY